MKALMTSDDENDESTATKITDATSTTTAASGGDSALQQAQQQVPPEPLPRQDSRMADFSRWNDPSPLPGATIPTPLFCLTPVCLCVCMFHAYFVFDNVRFANYSLV
eukprot:COSAG05_NODE_1505_length_4691_cov_73.111498_3_plen_107_part_00